MKTRLTYFSLILLTLCVLCLPVIQPLLTGEMPRTDDGNLHLYRVIALEHSLRVDGDAWPRYSSGLAYGYGSALFNYFPPTAYYPAVLLHGLGFSYVQSWTLAMALYVLVAATGAYALGRAVGDEISGFVTAIAYVYAPYLAFDIFTRGTLTEMAGLAVLPWAMAAFTQLAQHGRRGNFAGAIFAFALLIPLHNIVTLHGTLLLMAYCAFLLWSSPHKTRAFVQMLLAGVLAVSITAFFWLPALGETDATKLTGVSENLNFVDPTQTLRPLSETLALPRTYDPNQQQQPIPIALGWPQIVLALVGLGMAFWQQHPARGLLVVLGFFSLGLILLQMPAAAPIWQTVPLLDFSQFAWRMLSLPTLTLALMSGIAASLLLGRMASKSLQMGILSGFATVLVIYCIPWIYTPYFVPQANTIVDAQDYERQTGEVSLSSFGEYLPFWNQAALDPTALQERFTTADVIPRLQENDQVQLLDAAWSGRAATLTFEAAQPTTLIFDWLYMPGWQADFLDGISEPIALSVRPTQPLGLVSVDVPTGQHTLHIFHADTPLQTLSESVSLAALVLCLLVIGMSALIWTPTPADATPPPLLSRFGRREWFILMGFGFGLFAFKLLVIDTTPNPLRRTQLVEGQILTAEKAFNESYSGAIRLLGSSVVNTVKSGENAQISLFWALAGDALERDYSTAVRMFDANKNIITQAGSFDPAGTATSNWLPGFYLEEKIAFAIPDYTAPGTYTLEVSVFDAVTGEALSVLDTAGNPVAASVVIDSLTVTRPDDFTEVERDTIGQIAGLSLLDVTGLGQMLNVGDEINLSWTWRVDQTPTEAIEVRLAWSLEGTAQQVSVTDAIPLVENFPTSQWQPGDIWTGHHRLYVPGNLDRAASYTIRVIQQDAEAQAFDLATRPVQIPERNYEPVGLTNVVGLRWENGLELHSYEQDGSRLRLDWQTRALQQQSYRLFVQLVDDAGKIAALTDGIPANWTRPTSSWDTGEHILTEHPFEDLAAGRYQVRIGWYDPITGDRVAVSDADDAAFLFLPEPFIVPAP